MKITMRKLAAAAFAFAVASPFGLGQAATVTPSPTFHVKITIAAQCMVGAGGATDMIFPTQGVISGAITQQSTINVQCTNSTPYNIGLDAGAAAGATTTSRAMTGSTSAATVNYGLYRDAAFNQSWGNTIGTDTYSGTGTGDNQAVTVYGRVPAQNTPIADTYSDVITVAITY